MISLIEYNDDERSDMLHTCFAGPEGETEVTIVPQFGQAERAELEHWVQRSADSLASRPECPRTGS